MPKLETIANTGPEWLLHLLNRCTEKERLPVVMTLWRSWYVRNEVYHNKPAPPVEVSCRFLTGYINTLMHIQQHPGDDMIKEKKIVAYGDYGGNSKQHILMHACTRPPERWLKPSPGWVKLNVDGSWKEEDGTGGAGMIVRDQGVLSFTRLVVSLADVRAPWKRRWRHYWRASLWPWRGVRRNSSWRRIARQRPT